MKSAKRALDGLKIVEYSQFVSGPYCAKLLADLGAEVIKVEEPGVGDKARSLGPFLNDIPHPERSGLFSYLNTNKLGITLNVKTIIGKRIFHRLLEEADILVENNQPRLMKKLGIDYKSLSKINPRLIMTSATPFGQTGPYKDYKTCELLAYHTTGAGCTTPQFSGDRKPLKAGARLSEFYTGQTAAAATMCAVLAREMTQRGQHVDVSTQECFNNNLWTILPRYIFIGEIASRKGSSMLAPASVLPCRDGYVSFQVMTQAQWLDLVEVMGNPEWAQDERFKDPFTRGENWDQLRPLMEEWLSKQNKQDLFHAAQAKRAPVAPVNTMEEVVNCKQLAAREFFVEIEHPEIGRVKYPSAPYKFSETPWRVEQPAPLLGQHNEDIYCNRLGYTGKDLVRMRGEGII